ncbi:MAG TPA: NAD-dependent epimerase/dehydratase family protein, partial [Gaiellaceae bacterium]|nr:NAD-dependent epimerase/dehydratase family protein [Gaiellaceae bacterium]
MRAVVTGGAGFIGSNLVDTLVARGDAVTVVDNLASGKRENVHADAAFVERDIRDGFDVAGSDVVFHLAAQADVQTSMQ